MELTRIVLGGKLGQALGKEWLLDVHSPAEAIRAIDANTGGKMSAFLGRDNGRRPYKVALQKKDNLITPAELTGPSGKSDIYIMPVARGSKGGVGKIILGIILIVAAFIPGLNLVVIAVLAGMGSALILSGISQLLSPHAKTTQQLQSYNFQGNATAINQGACIPLIYGRVLVRPLPIAISFSASDLNSTASTNTANVGQTQVGGGSYQVTVDN